MAGLTIPDAPIEQWLAELKPYQRQTLEKFLASDDAEAVAEKWLTTIGSANIASFGGQITDPKPFWDRFKAECHKFICDDGAYSDEKKAILAEVPISKAMLISAMSSAIGTTLGTAGTLIAPAATLLLFTVGRMGLNAYCAKG
ncbi:MAG: hypothetical protein Q8R01_14645 [Ramlibacter sp.]|nr:hypothetical protein [Ramlibacter sp.]